MSWLYLPAFWICVQPARAFGLVVTSGGMYSADSFGFCTYRRFKFCRPITYSKIVGKIIWMKITKPTIPKFRFDNLGSESMYSLNWNGRTCLNFDIYLFITLCTPSIFNYSYLFLIKSNLWKQRTINDVTQFCELWSRSSNFGRQFGRSWKTLLLPGHGLAAAGGEWGSGWSLRVFVFVD